MRQPVPNKASTNGHTQLCPRCQRTERAAELGIDPAGPLTGDEFAALGGYSWVEPAVAVPAKIAQKFEAPIAEAEEALDRALSDYAAADQRALEAVVKAQRAGVVDLPRMIVFSCAVKP